MNVAYRATTNFRDLSRNSYPGRIITMGRTPNGTPAQIYAIMGRSDGSRYRRFELVPGKHGWLRTSFADRHKVSGDPELLIYHAMAEIEDCAYAVSNGRQTDDLVQCDGRIEVLTTGTWTYEPDPSHTPRISGVCFPGDVQRMQLLMLRKSPFGDACDFLDFSFGEVAPGFGYFISTYEADGDPLPPFSGEPLVMPIASDNPGKIAAAYWAALDADNRVSIAVKVIPVDGPSETKIINRYAVG